ALEQFQATIRTAIPNLAPENPPDDSTVDSTWSQDRAEVHLFERLDREDWERGKERQRPPTPPDEHHRAYLPSRIRWDHLGLSFAAIALFALGLGINAYRSGRKLAGKSKTDSAAATAL